jgi:ER-bound oxygenase mpaB/B'/Rubber oxygenase, catalytic domain
MGSALDDFLTSQRLVGDPVADQVVAEMFAHGTSGVETINGLLRDLVDNDDVPSLSLPAPVREYFVATDLPAWADRAAIDRASEFFFRYAPQIVTLLHVLALPTCYAARQGVQVLVRTNRMQSNTQRRVIETAQFVMDVMSAGGLYRDEKQFGAGVRSAQKVRLMHATIRRFLQHDPTYDKSWGVPVCQEDLAGTLYTFSAVTLFGLEKLSIDLTDAEKADYIHAWNVVGHLLGVDQRFLNPDYQTCLETSRAIGRRNNGACPEGQLMMRSLIEYLEYALPGTALDGLPALLVHELAGTEMAEMLAVKKPDMSSRWLWALRTLGHVSDDLGDTFGFVRHATAAAGRLTLQAMLLSYRGPQRLPYNIPTALREAHKIAL